MKVSRPFIQSQYSRSVFTLASGSACAAKLASGVQYAWQPCQPLPVSQASKKRSAIAVILAMSKLPVGAMTIAHPSDRTEAECPTPLSRRSALAALGFDECAQDGVHAGLIAGAAAAEPLQHILIDPQ